MEQAVPLFIADLKTLSVYTLNIKTEFQFNQHYPLFRMYKQTATPPPPLPAHPQSRRTTYVSQKKTNTEYIAKIVINRLKLIYYFHIAQLHN